MFSGVANWGASVFSYLFQKGSFEEHCQEILFKIAQNAANTNGVDFGALAASLNQLCGESGHAEINEFKGNLQVHLFFGSEAERQAAISVLSSKCADYRLPNQFEAWQLGEVEGLCSLKLSTNQSVALLCIDPNYIDTFRSGEQILQSTREATLTWMGLSDEFISQLCTYLPLSTLGKMAQVNKRIGCLLCNENKHMWELVASALDIHLSAESTETPKEQIKNSCTELSFATIDHLNHKVVMKRNLPLEVESESLKELFTRYIPKRYYIKHHAGYASHKVLYWNKDGTVGSFITHKKMIDGSVDLRNTAVIWMEEFEIIAKQ
jgi:hypothetical protein